MFNQRQIQLEQTHQLKTQEFKNNEENMNQTLNENIEKIEKLQKDLVELKQINNDMSNQIDICNKIFPDD